MDLLYVLRLDPLLGPVFRPRLVILLLNVLLDLEPLIGPGFLPLLNVLDLRVCDLEDLLSTLLNLLRRPNDLDAEPDL